MKHATLFPFWDKLTKEQQQILSESIRTETYEKGQIINRSVEGCKGLMAVVSGILRTYIVSEEGREITLFRVSDGEVCVLSASCLLDAIVFDVMIEVMEETKVQVIPSILLNQIMKENSQVELFLYKSATERFSDVMWTMQQILFLRIDQRVAQFLLEEHFHQKSTTLVMTHEEIARLIGSAREVVTKVLKYLAQEGVVELKRGKIEILDKEKLKSYI